MDKKEDAKTKYHRKHHKQTKKDEMKKDEAK